MNPLLTGTELLTRTYRLIETQQISYPGAEQLPIYFLSNQLWKAPLLQTWLPAAELRERKTAYCPIRLRLQARTAVLESKVPTTIQSPAGVIITIIAIIILTTGYSFG